MRPTPPEIHTRLTLPSAAAFSALLALALASATVVLGQQEPQVLDIPEVDVGENMLERRRQQQLEAIEGLQVRHDFRFEDRQPESGITFQHRFVDDGGKEYKMVHYDHGSGVAAADVDGDGRVDLYFTSQTGPNELWRNLGGGRFENVTERAGVALADRVTMSASFADVDNDGDADLYVTTVRMGNALFANDGSGRFEDVSEEAGVGYVGHSSAATFFDYDRDGWLDLFLANVGVFTTDEWGDGYWVGMEDAFDGHLKPERTETSILYRNQGDGTFRDVTEESGLVDSGWNGDAAFADVDGNGWLDLYVLNMQGDDHLWLNDGGRFTEATDEYFPKTPWGAMGVDFFDYDNNGWLDLILTDMHSDMGMMVEPSIEKRKSINTWTEGFLRGSENNIFGNAFYRNMGEGRFEEVSDEIGTENYWPWGLSVGDLNADGWEDVFIAASMSFPFRYGIDSMLLNDRGEGFVDAEFALGIEPRRDGRTRKPWFELDCSDADSDHHLCHDKEGHWIVTGTLGTRSSVIFDLDGDGDQDIVTLEFNARPQILVNDLAQRAELHYLEIVLEGSRSNRDGLGALVRVHAGERVLTRFHDGKSGYLAQSAMPLYVGLGDATAVEKIEVLWPSGVHQEVSSGIRLGARNEIREPEPAETAGSDE